MQNHMENSVVGRGGGGSYTSMLSGGTDPCFGGNGSGGGGTGPGADGFNMNGSSPGSDYSHLLSHSHNHHNHNVNVNHHQQQQQAQHHVETNNNHNNNNNNNNSTTTPTTPTTKPKKPPPPNGKKTKGRVKIKMEFIDNKLRRYTTFSKRKTGIMKKAYELSTLTGTQVMLLVASETGHVYTFATRKLQPMITSEAGKALIQTCLNSPDPPNSGSDTQRMSATGYEETELTYAADPNASDHGDTKDDESETGSSDAEESNKDVPPLLPLTNGLSLPTNFAALFASASAAGFPGTKLVSLAQDGPPLVGGGLANRSIASSPSLAHQQNRGPNSSCSSNQPSSTPPTKSIKIKRELQN